MQQQIAELAAQLENEQANKTIINKTFSKKVEVMADPGQYEGDRARFAEWWTKMKVWIKANWDGLANNFEICVAVWSRMK
ncbi:hypothetical protein BV22DRAFT_983707, partial [Leucogyrophana mollusca]